MDITKNRVAALVATTSTLLVAGALVFQEFGYPPCEMCMWQRWPHAGAATLATIALVTRGRTGRLLAILAIFCMATSGLIGIFHAGVEWKLWNGITTCAVNFTSKGGDVLTEIMKAPMIRCDEAAWRLMGISMAGYNAMISLGVALLGVRLLTEGHPTRRKIKANVA